MQIHELNNFAGTPTSSDYLAIDNSTTTTKIGATGLGIQDQMTVAEATTGTSTSPRVITPKVLHEYTESVIADIGTVVSGTGTESLANTTSMSKIDTLTTLSAGAWVCVVEVRFVNNATGTRAVQIFSNGSSISQSLWASAADSGSAMDIVIPVIVSDNEQMIIDLYGRQNSGSAMNITYYWRAIKIK